MQQRSAVIITKRGKILLMHRVKNGDAYYCIPGGSVEVGETIQEAAIREIREETGLDVTLGELLLTMDGLRGVEYFFLAKGVSGRAKLGGPERVISCKENHYRLVWVGLENITQVTLYPKQLRRALGKYVAKF